MSCGKDSTKLTRPSFWRVLTDPDLILEYSDSPSKVETSRCGRGVEEWESLTLTQHERYWRILPNLTSPGQAIDAGGSAGKTKPAIGVSFRSPRFRRSSRFNANAGTAILSCNRQGSKLKDCVSRRSLVATRTAPHPPALGCCQ